MPIDKELRIKYILDQSQFAAGIKSANAGLQQTGKHLDDGTQSALSMTKAMLGMVGVQSGMAAVGQVVSAIGSGMQEAAEYTKKVAEAFGATRESMREIAAIAGKGLTNEFVAGQLDVAQKAKILTPQEYTQGVKAFQQYGSNYIGTRVSQETLDSVLPDVMAAAKVQGVEQAPALELFAKLVQAMPKGTKAETYKTQFAKELQVMKDSSGSATITTSNLAPLLSQFVNPGGMFEPSEKGLMDITKLVATTSETNAGEAGAYTRQGLLELSKLDLKNQEESLGITEDMNVMQKIKAMTAQFMKETGGKQDATEWFRSKLGGRQGSVQGGAAIGAWINKGVREDFFGDLDRKTDGVTSKTLDDQLAAHLQTQGGRDDVTKASTAIGEARRGLDWSPVEAMKNRAKDELTNDPTHPLEQAWHGPVAALKNMVGGTSYEQQAINERALRDAQQDARAAGADPNTTMASSTTWGQHAIDVEIKRLVQLTEQLVGMKKQQAGNVPAPINGKPTVAPQAPR